MGSPAIFQPLLGRDVTVTIQPYAVDAAGVLSTSGSAVTFAGRMEELSGGRTEVELEQVQPMDCFAGNMVPIGETTHYRLSEIMMALQSAATGAAKGNKLLYVSVTCRYFLITVTGYNHADTPASVFTEAAICVWHNYDPNYRRGNAKTALDFQTVATFNSSTGVYGSNPTFTLPSS
jgi:hypothetical protein